MPFIHESSVKRGRMEPDLLPTQPGLFILEVLHCRTFRVSVNGVIGTV